jgi:anti-sigma factor RsiW
MNCEDYFTLISGLVDDELSNIERRIVRQHLDECEKCRKEWLTLSLIQDELMSISQPEASANILERVNQEIEEKESEKKTKFIVYPSIQGRTTKREEINYVRSSKRTA